MHPLLLQDGRLCFVSNKFMDLSKMDEKLLEYRARKQNEALKASQDKEEKERTYNSKEKLLKTVKLPSPNYSIKSEDEQESSISENTKSQEVSPVFFLGFRLDNVEMCLKLVIWGLLMVIFVILEFGAVFFAVSVFYLIYRNFRKTPKKPGELSAYSVFNPNFETIDGTLTAQQFERELLYGATAVH